MAPTSLKLRADTLVPQSYAHQGSSLTPGAVAGVVLGSVAGVILILVILYSCLGFGPRVMSSEPSGAFVRRRHGSHGSHHHHHNQSHHHTSDKYKYKYKRTKHGRRSSGASHHHRRSGSGAGPRIVRETVNVRTQDRRSADGGRPRGGGAPDPIYVRRPGGDSVDDDDDEVVVIEDHGPRRPRR
ncbi:hypothetical protein GMORB2_0483 [Geosmithia morbida]|uniref:Uncharacterized protein n=1 Tax=Geosmithia morbida TaxID=1094350 RepID=A0A9P4Z3B5_9HYPO|nr:uncharacterized protein GMORB2_0483 [Geosmithia morbida]KAF4126746.1 hypothetical protein GMORB2_0483 [Geosmithia morbida]